MTRSVLLSKPVVWLLLAMFSAASMEFYTAQIWSADQPAGFNDLYARWWGSHELLLHGRNPYSPEVSHEIQTVIYGAPVTPSPEDPEGIGGGFAYPPYAALLYWPTVRLPFQVAQKIFVVLSIAATLLGTVFWMGAFRFRAPPLICTSVAIFTVGSFPALQGIELQNPSLIAAALIAATIFLLSREHLVTAGIFLAASSFKPQFVIILIPWLALWALADWRRRRALAVSFAATLCLLFVWSEWLVPGWLPSFLHVIRAYGHYTYGHSLIDVWLTPALGRAVSATLLLACLILCWPARSHSAGSQGFLISTSLLLAASVVVIPTLAPHAQLLLVPGFLCLLPAFRAWWVSTSFARMLRPASWMLLAWPWAAAFGLMVAAIWLPVAKLHRFWQVPLYTSPVIPMAVALALAFLVGGALRPENSEA